MRIPYLSRRAVIGAIAGATLLVATGATALAVSRVDDHPSPSGIAVTSSVGTTAPTGTTLDDRSRQRGDDHSHGRYCDDDHGRYRDHDHGRYRDHDHGRYRDHDHGRDD